ncbi:uncharacterized protein LOC111085414 [Limulus polyphemus]|uniref:Uncharacterized protein LOC111085414 n=1 Tax=Limulus polyphemus TaxID=6850 RepID=A0ABM1S7E6_LIMPO|nr:uncharacterized protein LOC111085414 [Limulus polyphemus]
MSDEGGTKEETVREQVSSAWCLSKEEVESLGKVGILVESAFGSARDIEWAINNGKNFLLQARPITTEDKPTDYELVHGLDSGLLTENEYLTIANVGERGQLLSLACVIVGSQVFQDIAHLLTTDGVKLVADFFLDGPDVPS